MVDLDEQEAELEAHMMQMVMGNLNKRTSTGTEEPSEISEEAVEGHLITFVAQVDRVDKPIPEDWIGVRGLDPTWAYNLDTEEEQSIKVQMTKEREHDNGDDIEPLLDEAAGDMSVNLEIA